jgi:hypothetical protein
MRKYIFWVLLFASITSQAQNIRGKVCLEKDKSPAQFATVGLVQLPDSSMITGVITLTDGGYTFEKVKPGAYFIKVSYVGCKTNGKNVTLAEGSAEVTADTIFLAETTTSLNEVTVVGERLKGKEMVDRTVYAVPAAIAKSSNNGYDILRKIPQVNVDFQNNVTLNGSSNFIIQVDGRQRDREFLARLLPSDIESIEIISNPSGRYEGNIDGVINIILKKEARYGMNGNVSLSSKPFNKPTNAVTGSIDYALGKITFYATGVSFIQKLDITSRNKTRFATIDSTTNLMGNGGIKVTQTSINSGFDYYLNDKNNLSFNFNYKPIGQDVDFFSETVLYKKINPLNTVSSLSHNGTSSNENSVSLFYKKTFKKPIREFTAETNYYWFRSNVDNNFTNLRYPYNSDLILNTFTRQEVDTDKRNYSSTRLNYVEPVGMNTKLEAGYQLYYQKIGYVFNINNQESPDLFKYEEFRNSVYSGITFNLKKIGAQAMLRIENSHIKADSITEPVYSCILPSINLQYKFSASKNLKFTYNRRINRPGIYDMNPYYKIGQTYNITQGNPDLKPDYRDRLQLTYTMNFGSNYFSPYIYQEYFSDKVGTEYTLTKSPITNSLTTIAKPFNLISGYESGGGLTAMLWYININARIFKGHYNAYSGPSVFIPAVDYFSYSITSYAYYQPDKKKTITAFTFLSYNGVSMNAQSKTYSIPFYGFGGQKQLKNHTFGVFWFLPMSTNVRLSRTETETTVFNSSNSIGFNASNFFQFSYSYKFNKGKNVKKLDRKVEVESDSKSQTIGR